MTILGAIGPTELILVILILLIILLPLFALLNLLKSSFKSEADKIIWLIVIIFIPIIGSILYFNLSPKQKLK